MGRWLRFLTWTAAVGIDFSARDAADRHRCPADGGDCPALGQCCCSGTLRATVFCQACLPRARHLRRAAIRLLAHHLDPAADLHAGRFRLRPDALSRRDVLRRRAGDEPVHHRRSGRAQRSARSATTRICRPSTSSCRPTTRTPSSSPRHSRRRSRWTTLPTSSRSTCSTMAAPTQRSIRRDPRVALPAQRRRATLQGARRAARLPLRDACEERACQGRQPQCRPGRVERPARRRVRRRPCARSAASCARRSATSSRIRACSWCRRRTSSSIPTRSRRTCAPSRCMPSENEMFYGLIQRGLDRWNASFFCGSAALLRRRALDSVGRLLRHHHHRGLRDRARAARPGLEQRLCREAADRRPAARDAVELHRPALALVPRHDPDPPPEEPAVPARPDASHSASATSPIRSSGSFPSRA